MVERALQLPNSECAVARPAALGNAMQRAAEFYARSLKFKDELLQIVVFGFLEAQFIGFVPDLHRAFMTAMLERMSDVAVGGANPVYALPVRFRFGRRFVQC